MTSFLGQLSVLSDGDEDCYSLLASAQAALGYVEQAAASFQKARLLHNSKTGWGAWYPDFLIRSGQIQVARSILEQGIAQYRNEGDWQRVALLEAAFGTTTITAIDTCRRSLDAARAFASRSGHIEVALRCHHLAAQIARREGRLSVASSEALDGIQLADSCGFGRWSLEIRSELARTHLAANDPRAALEPAEWVLKRSQGEDCKYAWGEADSLFLLGVAHARLANKAKAREFLSLAVEKRRLLDDPGLLVAIAELQRLD